MADYNQFGYTESFWAQAVLDHLFPAIMSKYDVIHKTRTTQRIATLPEEDQATTMGK